METQAGSLPFDPVMRPRHAAAFLGISRPTLYRWVREGRLPRPVRYGPGTSGWRRSVLEAHLAEIERAAAEARAAGVA